LKGWGANLRGDAIKIKKELMADLDCLEILEDSSTLSEEQYARKGLIQLNLMKIYQEEENFWQ
jgi:hypothetical protein